MKAYRKMSAAYAGKGGIVAAVFEKGRAKGFEEGRVEGRRDREQKLGADGRPALDAGGPPSKQTLTAGIALGRPGSTNALRRRYDAMNKK